MHRKIAAEASVWKCCLEVSWLFFILIFIFTALSKIIAFQFIQLDAAMEKKIIVRKYRPSMMIKSRRIFLSKFK